MTEYKVNPVNRYQLANEETSEADLMTEVDKPPKIPPIISFVHKYKIMTDTVTKGKYSVKINGDKVKIIPTKISTKIDGYRKIVTLLKDTKVQYLSTKTG